MHLMPQFEHGMMEAGGSMDMEGDDKGEEATPRRILSSSTPSSQRPLNFRKKFLMLEVGSDSGGWSEKYSFISWDIEASETIAFLFGDLGTYVPYNTYFRTPEESLSTVKWILRDLTAYWYYHIMRLV